MIKRFLHIVLILQLSGTGLLAQPWFIQGSIEHAGPGLIRLASYYGDRFAVIDSMETGGGSFHFALDDRHEPGLYRLIFPELYQGVLSENRFVEFIFNREDVNLIVDMGLDGPRATSDGSLENLVYQDFMNFQISYEQRLRQAYEGLFPNEPGNPVWEASVDYYEALQQGRLDFMDSLSILYPELYATRIMNAFRTPLMSGRISHQQRIDSLKQLFFLDAPLDDPALLRAPVYTFRMVDYLSLYRDPSLEPAKQEEAFMGAVDYIMANVSADEELQSFVIDFLLEGFELLAMETVQMHIMDTYVDESCVSDAATMVAERMEGYRRMAVGSPAPDFVVRDVEGRTHSLGEMGQDRVLVLFWSSTCVHCRDMIPGLHQWFEEERPDGIKVVSLSIDASEEACMEFLEAHPLPLWINVHEAGGWQGRVASDYHVYATPTMYLLDGDGIIMEKPKNLKQLLRALR